MVRVTDDAKWAPIVGEFMLAFGSIESAINELLSRALTENALKHVIKMMLLPRVNFLRAVLPDMKLSAENQAALLSNLKEVERLIKTRNHIAHNPLVLSLYETPDEKATDIQKAMKEVIRHEHSGTGLEFDELCVLKNDAMKLSSVLLGNWCELDFAEMDRRPPMLKAFVAKVTLV